jgi:hypothetical protein
MLVVSTKDKIKRIYEALPKMNRGLCPDFVLHFSFAVGLFTYFQLLPKQVVAASFALALASQPRQVVA